MKETLIVIMTLTLMSSANAQVIINDVNINELDITVCQMIAVEKFMSTKGKVNIIIDYGQAAGQYSGVVDGADKKPVTFNGVIDGINFMERNGWKLQMAYVVTESNQSVYHYIFRKKDDD